MAPSWLYILFLYMLASDKDAELEKSQMKSTVRDMALT